MTLPGSRPAALLVDVGNTRVKWRITGPGESSGFCSIDELAAGAPPSWSDAPSPGRVLVSLTGRPELATALKEWTMTRWRVAPEFPDSSVAVPGMRNRYANPLQLGVDRWLALIAVRRSDHGPVVVVDCGTAMTVDLMNGSGDFLGGMIVPGREVLESVFKQRVPYLDSHRAGAARFPADDTRGAITLGVRFALVASVERFVDNAARLVGAAPTVHVTGGDASWLCGHLPAGVLRHENLVLDGLEILLELTP